MRFAALVLTVALVASAALGAQNRASQQTTFEVEQELSTMLLNVGYNFYKSGSTVESEKPRRLILGAAWHAAFSLREQRAVAAGNQAEAAVWSERREQLTEATRQMDQAYSRKRGG